MVRNVLAVIAGMLVAVVVVMLAEMAGHGIWPPPEGLDPGNAAQIAQYVKTAPIGMLGSVLAAWLLGMFLGVFTATKVARGVSLWPAAIVATLFFLATAFNLYAIPHPLWLNVAAIIGMPLAAWLAVRVVRKAAP